MTAMYEPRVSERDNGDGLTPDPIVTITTTGIHDVSRLVLLLHKSGNTEQGHLLDHILNELRTRPGGQAALQLLVHHGGPDYRTTNTLPPPADTPPNYTHLLHNLLRATINNVTVDDNNRVHIPPTLVTLISQFTPNSAPQAPALFALCLQHRTNDGGAAIPLRTINTLAQT